MTNAIQWVTVIAYDDNEEVQRFVVPANLGEQVVKGIKQSLGLDAEIILN